MRILVTGGGTAGHINPALAITEIIKKNEPDTVAEFVGTQRGLEYTLVPKAGYKLHEIKVRGLSRSLNPANIKALFQAYTAIGKCKKIIKEFKPDVVIGTGGYVCWPVIKAASALNIPTVLHESNAQPGFAVKTLKDNADIIMTNFEVTKASLAGSKAEIIRVGMPVNREFFASDRLTKTSSECKHTILSFGGSLGAQNINKAALKLMIYLKDKPYINYTHACGTRNFNLVYEEYKNAGLDKYSNIKLVDYIYNMPEMMKNCDLIVCRSGASTLAEIAATGTPSILVPSSNVTNDQQTKNALQFTNAGAAIIIEDDRVEAELTEAVAKYFRNGSAATNMKNALKKFVVNDCETKIYNSISGLVKSKKKD